jgi:cyclophilin family peptidyl-prolyl cis-trans isomerase/HEAT repeat protein
MEREPVVRAALLESVGRLAQESAGQVTATATLIGQSLLASSIMERRGAIRGLYFLSRTPQARRKGAIPASVTDKVFGILTAEGSASYSSADRVNLATILANASALDSTRIDALFRQNDPNVRDRAVAAVMGSADSSLVRGIVGKALADTAPIVRYRGITVFARRLRSSDGCKPLVALARDRNTTVAIAAVDALGGCRSDNSTSHFLDSLAGSFRNGDAWHLPAHALVSLAAVDPPHARSALPIFAQATDFFVRMYADSAARLMRDTVALYRLARDQHPNVRSSAIAGLSKLVGSAADSLYLRALNSDDNQLLMIASAALKSPTDTLAARRALLTAWRRLVGENRETSREGRDAVAGRLRALGSEVQDTAVKAPTQPTPTFAELAMLERAVATIEMGDGTIITIRFYPFDAPTNVARCVRLARAGVFDGLTFHRVAPFFVVQGPSPNANEYSAPDAVFTRDELGRENLRGTIGISTRGRDTGDGQFYVNTADNTWLDHEYTVMATVTSGIDAFDRMQEGAPIRHVRISPP